MGKLWQRSCIPLQGPAHFFDQGARLGKRCKDIARESSRKKEKGRTDWEKVEGEGKTKRERERETEREKDRQRELQKRPMANINLT